MLQFLRSFWKTWINTERICGIDHVHHLKIESHFRLGVHVRLCSVINWILHKHLVVYSRTLDTDGNGYLDFKVRSKTRKYEKHGVFIFSLI